MKLKIECILIDLWSSISKWKLCCYWGFFQLKEAASMDFSIYPCGVPVDVKNSEKINDIMNKSWIIQKGLRVTNACLVVNLVLHRGLKAIGVH